MTTQLPEKDNAKTKSIRSQVWMPLRVGCLTFLVAGLALVGGLWLDVRLETFPRWTLILVLGSAPLTLVGVFIMVRHALEKSQDEQEAGEKNE